MDKVQEIETAKAFFKEGDIESAVGYAAVNGLLILHDDNGALFFGKSACDIYDKEHLLLTHYTRENYWPAWIEYNREKNYPKLASMEALCNAFISYYGLTRKKGAFYANGEEIAPETIRENLLACLSIVSKEPAKRLEAAEKQLMLTIKEPKQTEEEEKQEYFSTSAGANLQQFINGVGASADTEAIPTGFEALDGVLDGGLYEGLITVGAISSLGKTSLCLQIADQVAAAGRDVLYFSLEMARAELMSKSISRHTVQLALERGIDTKAAKTARGITDGKRYANYTSTETGLIQDAIGAYSKYADRLYIQEGIGEIGAKEIRQTIEKHILYTGGKLETNEKTGKKELIGGRRPLVIVDYLQILAPVDIKASDKQNTDRAVLELKRASRDYKLPVIAVSSFNRGNYNAEVAFEAFKESGAIEYGSDIVIGLQLNGAGEKGFNSIEAKKKNPRQVELVILKNRQGKVGDKIEFSYYPMFNFFREEGIAD